MVLRRTLNNQGFCKSVRALVWREVARVVVGAEDASEATVIARINAVCQFPSVGEAAAHRLGPALDRDVLGRGGGGARGGLFDMLCARLGWLMQYEEGERDLV